MGRPVAIDGESKQLSDCTVDDIDTLAGGAIFKLPESAEHDEEPDTGKGGAGDPPSA